MNPHRTRNRSQKQTGRLIVGFCLCLLFLMPAGSAHAETWMFRRSYFSHAIPKEMAHRYPVPRSRHAYRRAYLGARPGFSVRGGYRVKYFQLNNGSSSDTTILRFDWFESGP